MFRRTAAGLTWFVSVVLTSATSFGSVVQVVGASGGGNFTQTQPTIGTAKVWIVDASGGGVFTQIQPAIDAAADRDTILIKSGSYDGFTIDARSLAVVGDSGADVDVSGQVIIRNVSIDAFVVMGGFEVTGSAVHPYPDLPALRLDDNAGPVRVQDARFRGYREAVRVQFSPDVYFTECDMTGMDGFQACCTGSTACGGGDGLVLLGSSAALYDCTLRAGDGGDGTWSYCCYGDGGPGGNACEVTDGFLFASNSFFYGGDGGHGRNGDCFSCGGTGYGGDGGHGIAIAGSEGNLLGCVIQGGALGHCGVNPDNTCACNNGAPGQAIDHPDQVLILSSTRRRMVAPLVVRETGPLPLNFFGLPGDVVHLYLTRETDFQFSEPRRGVFIVPPSSVPSVVGQVDSTGQLSQNTFVPELGAVGQTRTYFLQSLHRLGASDRTLGTGRSLVVVGQQF